ncbi:ATP-binding protein [Sphingomonas sp. RB1R13]|uniref:ATP-binding protein n=1 Tax=Sphingomonas sp. RB1R13 TaxID=3096159 RepID=UPI002FC711B3
MHDMLKPFFDGSYEPHGYCLLWNPGLIWTHVVSDLLIAAAYFSIPLALVSLIRRRKDLEFSWIFMLFAVFILACGMTHILSVWNLWHGDYGIEAVVKAITAAASIPTAIILWPLIPRLLALPSPSQLQTANENLAVMVAERDDALDRVREEAAQRQHAEDALVQAKKIEALGQLTGGIAHDFNNLLQAIAGNLELIAGRAGTPDPDKIARWSGNALQAVDRGRRLTGQLLTFSRSQRIEARVIDAAALVGAMDPLLRQSVGPAIDLRITADPGTCPVETDATQLELAVLNLAVNARDAMPDGGTVDIAVERGVAMVAIRVTDHGTGMTPDVAERALEPFFTTKGPGSGTGLGLSMAYGVAQAAGGDLVIDSMVGRGTTVTIHLPLTGQLPAANATATLSTVTSQPVPVPARKMILLVDDDEVVRTAIEDMLCNAGHQVTAVPGGEAALAAFKDREYDLVLLDFAMPGMNGAQLAGHLLEQRPTQRIVFVSGYSDSAAIDAALNGKAEILAKPVDSQLLLDTVAAA